MNTDNKVHGSCRQMTLDVVSPRSEELSEHLEAQRADSFSALALGRDQMIVKLADFLRLLSWVVAADHRCVLAKSGVSFDRGRPAAFVAIVCLPPPQLAHDVIARDQAVVSEPLAKRRSAHVVNPFDGGFDTTLGFIRRANSPTVEEDVVLNLQSANLVFELVEFQVSRTVCFRFHFFYPGGPECYLWGLC